MAGAGEGVGVGEGCYGWRGGGGGRGEGRRQIGEFFGAGVCIFLPLSLFDPLRSVLTKSEARTLTECAVCGSTCCEWSNALQVLWPVVHLDVLRMVQRSPGIMGSLP